MDYSQSGSSVHGISQSRIWEWVAISLLQRIFLTQRLNLHLLHWQVNSFTAEPPGKSVNTPRCHERKDLLLSSSLLFPYSFEKLEEHHRNAVNISWVLWTELEEGNGTPLPYSCLENPMDGGAWWAAVHGVAKNQTWLGDFTFTFHFYALQKEMATHSSVLAWRIPGMGLHRVGYDWSDLAVAAIWTASECNKIFK